MLKFFMVNKIVYKIYRCLDDRDIECIELAFLTLCDLALNPPFLGGKMIQLGKFCFIKTKFEPNLSCFSK